MYDFMTNLHSNTALLAFFVVTDFVMPDTASAYLDPGSGSFIIQMLIASVAGITFALRAYIARFMYFIKYTILRRPKDAQEVTSDINTSDENK